MSRRKPKKPKRSKSKSSKITFRERAGKRGRHHILAQVRGGRRAVGNIIKMDDYRHAAFHTIFGHCTFLDAAKTLRGANKVINGKGYNKKKVSNKSRRRKARMRLRNRRGESSASKQWSRRNQDRRNRYQKVLDNLISSDERKCDAYRLLIRQHADFLWAARLLERADRTLKNKAKRKNKRTSRRKAK